MNTNNEKRFLVFSGGNDRAVLGFLRALRLCGKHAVIVARTNDDRILFTRFREDVKWTRKSHDLTMDIFTECVQRVREHAGDRHLVVLPSTEYFNAFLLRHRGEIESMGCEIPLVDASIYMLLTGKRSAVDYFSAAGLSVPSDLDASIARAPLVAKPLRNISRQGRSLYPRLMHEAEELQSFLTEQDADEYFLQEYVHGESLYLLFYVPRNGSAEFVWSQRNLMQQPGGKSILLAEPADFHRTPTATHTVELLRQTGFWGLGMIEFIQTPDRQVFIEMNPRVWGPVQLCVDHRQDLLQAFIGEALHDDPLRFAIQPPDCNPRRKKYFWMAGLADTLAAGKQPTWHATKRSTLAVITTTFRDDVYLRTDSWRCFFRDLKSALKLALHRERT